MSDGRRQEPLLIWRTEVEDWGHPIGPHSTAHARHARFGAALSKNCDARTRSGLVKRLTCRDTIDSTATHQALPIRYRARRCLDKARNAHGRRRTTLRTGSSTHDGRHVHSRLVVPPSPPVDWPVHACVAGAMAVCDGATLFVTDPSIRSARCNAS